MGTRVKLTYNPVTKAVTLADGKKDMMTPRLSEFLRGDMDGWLEYRTISYRMWSGLLPELMQELNDDGLEITFSGSAEDYGRVRQAFERQSESLGEYGFSPGLWTLAFERNDALDEAMRRLKSAALSVQDFALPNEELQRRYCGMLAGMEEERHDEESVRQAILSWQELFEDAVRADGNEGRRGVWEEAIDALRHIDDRGGMT